MHIFRLHKNEDFRITRGVDCRENYYIPRNKDKIYDLRFTFPLNFFSGRDAYDEIDFEHTGKDDKSKKDSNVEDIGIFKIASKNSAMLGFSKSRLATIYFPGSFIAL